MDWLRWQAEAAIAAVQLSREQAAGIGRTLHGAWYDVQVTTTFKGKPPLRLRLFSENSTARFWLNKGERYLLFVTEEAFDPPVGHA